MNAPLLILDRVHVSFLPSAQGARVLALDSLSWTLHKGQHWAIIGPNGAGKSTLLRVIRGEQRPDQIPPQAQPLRSPEHTEHPGQTDPTGHTGHAGSVTWLLDGTPETTPLAVRRRIACVTSGMQEHYVRQQWQLSGEDMLLTGWFDSPLLYETPTQSQRDAAQDLARALDVQHLLDMHLPAMSQGQLRKMLVARALIGSPDILVLDEMCEGLDPASRAGVLETVDRAAALGTTVLFATHRLEELPACITHGMLLTCGRIAVQGSVADVTQAMEQEHCESLCPRSPQAAPSSGLPPSFARSGTASSDCTGRTGYIGHIGRIDRTIPAEPLIDIADATVFINRVPVLHNITWSIRPGQNWAVCGPNGAGKSTLLRLLLGDTRQAWGGTVRWFGQETPEMHCIRRRIGYVSDRLQATYGHDAYHGTLLDLTGEELVWSGFSASVGLWEWQHITPEQKQAAAAWMHHMGLADHAAQRIRDMSYGRLRRFMLCRAVAPSPDLLVLDEPCSGLDPAARDHFLATLRGLVQSGMQVVYVSHYASELIPEISHILRLESGHVAFCGPRGQECAEDSHAGESATAQGNASLPTANVSTGTCSGSCSGTCSGAETEPAPLLIPGTPFRGLIQIAGIRDMDEAAMLIRSGVHALGFPLRLPVNTPDCTEQAAADMARALSANSGSTAAIPVCICYLNTADAIAAFCRQLHMSRVQLHGPVSPDELRRLRHTAPHLFIIKSLVLHPDGGNLPELERTLALAAPFADAFITDTRNPATGADGATGMVHNWQASARLVRLSPRPVILAGGLTPDNVAQAIHTVRPAGVDAHTGVEGPDGRKDPRLVQGFVSQAKKAFTEICASTS